MPLKKVCFNYILPKKHKKTKKKVYPNKPTISKYTLYFNLVDKKKLSIL